MPYLWYEHFTKEYPTSKACLSNRYTYILLCWLGILTLSRKKQTPIFVQQVFEMTLFRGLFSAHFGVFPFVQNWMKDTRTRSVYTGTLEIDTLQIIYCLTKGQSTSPGPKVRHNKPKVYNYRFALCTAHTKPQVCYSLSFQQAVTHLPLSSIPS